MGNWLELMEKGVWKWGGSAGARESQAFREVITERRAAAGLVACVGHVESGLAGSGEAILEAGSQ